MCRYILFCKGLSPERTGATEVKLFLEYLIIRRGVSASTQNQALSALVFFYEKVWWSGGDKLVIKAGYISCLFSCFYL